MRIWLTCFGVLFAIAELFQWLKHLMLPLPIYILGGAFLAIASNYNKLVSWLQREPVASSESVIGFADNPPKLGNAAPQQPQKSISFTIRRADESKE
jgi:hypothetical protein